MNRIRLKGERLRLDPVPYENLCGSKNSPARWLALPIVRRHGKFRGPSQGISQPCWRRLRGESDYTVRRLSQGCSRTRLAPSAAQEFAPQKCTPLLITDRIEKKGMPQRGTPSYWLRGLTRGVLGVFI